MLQLSVGKASSAGRRPRNEDSLAWSDAEGEERVSKGVLLAVADGVGGCDDGALASGLVVRGLLADYYATPDTWEPALALQRVIQSLNRWLSGQAGRAGQTLATTLSALVLRGHRYAIAHVGDTRIYRLRQQQLECLTRDHVWEQAGMQHVLTRAVGLDVALAVDYFEGDLQAGDIFVLLTDGVWQPLGEQRLHQLLHLHQEPSFCAQALIDAALAAQSQDNVSALVVRVDDLPEAALSDELAASCDWPVPPRLRPGQTVDGFVVEELLHDTRASVLYRVRHAGTGRSWVLKTLAPLLATDAQARAALLTEEWLCRRLIDPVFPQVMPMAAGERNWLYFIMSWHSGSSLQAMAAAGHHFSVPEIVDIGRALARALSVMHRLHILHRDIKPDNLHLGDDGHLRVLDMGIASCEGLTSTGGAAGTPSYMAPELFAGEPHSLASDVYAAGVSLYYLLTRHYPYGEIEPFQSPRFADPVPPGRYRADIPLWLEQVLLKAVAREASERLETADELLLVLEKGELDPVRVRVRSPLVHRQTASFWAGLALLSLAFNLLLVYLLLVSRA